MMAVYNIIHMRAAHISERSSQDDGNIRSLLSDRLQKLGGLFDQRTVHQNDIHVGESPQQAQSILHTISSEHIVLCRLHHQFARRQALGLFRLDHQNNQGWQGILCDVVENRDTRLLLFRC